MTGEGFRVLVVCTGNICRSPAGERWLEALADDSVSVSSAGVAALVGADIDPAMADLMSAAGLSVDGFAARQLTPAMIRHADLVLTMTGSHRRWVVERVPAAVRKTYTLLELARIARLVDERYPGAATSTARRLIGLELAVPHVRPRLSHAAANAGAEAAGTPAVEAVPGLDGLDVPDPYRGDATAFQHVFDQIRAAVRVVVGQPPVGA